MASYYGQLLKWLLIKNGQLIKNFQTTFIMNNKSHKTMPPDDLYRNGVGIMISNREKKICIGKRLDSYDNSKAWQMPQGGIEIGEEEEIAMFRELQEETGIKKSSVKIISRTPNYYYYNLPPQLQKKLWNGKYLGQKQRWYILQLEDEDSAINVKTEHPEFIDWKWSDKEEVVELIIEFKKDLYRDVINTFNQFLINAN